MITGSVEAAAARPGAALPPFTRPLRRDAAVNRERLLEAAERVFALRGIDATVEEVAREAGVGVGTLYRRFPTKDSLLSELIRKMLAEVTAAAEDALAQPADIGLEAFLVRASEIHVSNRGSLQRLWSRAGETQLENLRRLVQNLLERAQAAGTVRADIAVTDITVAFWATRGIIETTRDTYPDAWRRHLEFVIAGFRPNGTPLVNPALTRNEMDRIASLSG